MLKVYIETTVWSFAFADDSPDYARDTLHFFDICRKRSFDTVISPVVLKEVARSHAERRISLEGLISEISPVLVPAAPEIDRLTEAFLSAGAVPPKKPDDAEHVAAAFVAGCEVLVSWNFKHIANYRRAEKFNAVAMFHGFTKALRIITPAEMLYGDESP